MEMQELECEEVCDEWVEWECTKKDGIYPSFYLKRDNFENYE